MYRPHLFALELEREYHQRRLYGHDEVIAQEETERGVSECPDTFFDMNNLQWSAIRTCGSRHILLSNRPQIACKGAVGIDSSPLRLVPRRDSVKIC